ncbi:energy transducer TonB [Sphingomonas sp. S1-29]|uniref:hypothetical protein n=1 Tax=Sphingomonas sp. S1-29 TaxID=2991074 RepID=UPI00223ECF14|nr:hypothetical protein [Sphingomonas sp. S1-29]UZK70391.1 energy transducer TonB [Sphingomonas sp. S1-29]
MAPLDEAVAAWIDSKGVVPVDPQLSTAQQLPLWRAMLAKAVGAGDQAAEFAASWWLAKSPLIDVAERRTHTARAIALAQAMQAPAPAMGRLAITRIDNANERPSAWRKGQRAMLADPRYGADPLTASTLSLRIAAPGEGQREPEDASALLDAVIAQPALDARHPLKIAARLRRANLAAKAGDLAAAQAQFQQTGLTEQQCALIGVKPALRSHGMGNSDYPMLASKIGFEGWVSLELDVSADGSTLRPRTLIAYPPFVFGESAVAAAKNFRFESSYRPSGGTACTASQHVIRYGLNYD